MAIDLKELQLKFDELFNDPQAADKFWEFVKAKKAIESPTSTDTGQRNITQMKVEFIQGPVSEENMDGYVATIEELKICDSGDTKADAFRQVLKSIGVLLAYNSDISADELTEALTFNQPPTDTAEELTREGEVTAIAFAEWIGEQGLFNWLSPDNIRRWHKMVGNSKARTTEELYKEFTQQL